jgi:hypothetical protein
MALSINHSRGGGPIIETELGGRVRKFRLVAFGILFFGLLATTISGISLALVEQDRRINGLADVAFVDDCELEALGNILGFTPTRYPGGGPKDCDAPDPIDVQEDLSNVALGVGVIAVLAGGSLVWVSKKRPDLLLRLKMFRPKTRAKNPNLGMNSRERLQNLESLRAEGLVDEQEYLEQRRRLLEEL